MADLATPPAPPAPSHPSPIPASAPKAPAAPPPSAPAPAAPAAEKPAPSGGMKDFISNMGKKPEPKHGTAAAGVPQPPQPNDQQTPAAPPAEILKPNEPADIPIVGDDVWEKAPKNLKNSYYKYKRESETKLGEYERKLKELEGKSHQSPEDLKKIKSLEERSAKLEKDLEEREQRLMQADYSKSEDFNRLYVQKGNKAYQQAVNDVKRLMVKATDADGNETQRQATQADFDSIRSLEPFQQDQKLSEMFGMSAFRVAGHLRALENLENEANEAITNARTIAEEKRRTDEKKRAELDSEFHASYEQELEKLGKHEAGYFAPDPANPEASEALDRGYKYIDNFFNSAKNMTPRELAETKATVRALTAYAPRAMIEIKQLRTENDALKEELGKYRKSGPGSVAPSVSSAKPPAEEARGVGAIIELMKNTGKK